MTNTTLIDETYSIQPDSDICRLINQATAKLLSNLPRHLKILSYLRLCCLAMHKLPQKPGLAAKNSGEQSLNPSYSHLLKALYNRNPLWWQDCWIDERGILKANDPIINKLLQPLEQLIETHS